MELDYRQIEPAISVVMFMVVGYSGKVSRIMPFSTKHGTVSLQCF